MSAYMRELGAAVRAWSDSCDPAGAGIPVVDVTIRDRYDEDAPVTIELRELTSDDFRYLVASEAAARAEDGPVEHHTGGVEPGDVLRYTAARLEMLTNSHGFSHGVNLRWPTNAAAVLTEASRSCGALADLVEIGIDGVLEGLRGGAVVALAATEGPQGVPDQAKTAENYAAQAAAAMERLHEITRDLRMLSGAVGQLQHTSTAIGVTTADGPTLVAEVVLEYKLPGMGNTGRYHVRVFHPENAKPLVLIGDMADNHSTSVTNGVEEIAATIAEELLDGAAWDAVSWVQFYAPGRYVTIADGVIQPVEFSGPFEGPGWGFLTHDELEERAGGPVKSWHAQDHTVSKMTAQGIAVVRPETRRRRPLPPDTSGPVYELWNSHKPTQPDPIPPTDKPSPRRRWWQRRS